MPLPSKSKPLLLVLCADEQEQEQLRTILDPRFRVSWAADIEAAELALSGQSLKRKPLAQIFACDGFALTRIQMMARIKKLSKFKPPVVVFSGDEREQSIAKAYAAGASEYLLKPLRKAELVAKVLRFQDRRGSRVAEAIPRRIGAYALQEAIGRGGTSAVFRAHHAEAPGEDLALKLVWPHLVNDSEVMQRFRREIVLLQNLEHENLVRFIASGRHEDWFYYVMEHIEGGTLRERIKEGGPCDPKTAANLLLEMSKPLAYLHAQGLIHRDVKPENIYLTDNRMVLGDFGLVKLFTDRGITLDEDVIGTPLYLAPEALKNIDVDRRADIYAIGMCALEWLYGDHIFKASDPVALIGKIVNEGVPSPKSLVPHIPDSLNSLLEDCLATDPSERISDADMLKGLALSVLEAL